MSTQRSSSSAGRVHRTSNLEVAAGLAQLAPASPSDLAWSPSTSPPMRTSSTRSPATSHLHSLPRLSSGLDQVLPCPFSSPLCTTISAMAGQQVHGRSSHWLWYVKKIDVYRKYVADCASRFQYPSYSIAMARAFVLSQSVPLHKRLFSHI
jgi:hypothetical protein